MGIVSSYFAGIEVFNGSFNRSVPEDCEGGTVRVLSEYQLDVINSHDDHLGLTMHEYRFLLVSATFTSATALLRLLIEIVQLCRHPLEYLTDWVNWLEVPLYLSSIIFTAVFATPCLCVANWQWQVGVTAVFLGWTTLLFFLQKWPVMGVYVLMIANIIQTFLKAGVLALLLVIAFALAFYMLFFEADEMVSIYYELTKPISFQCYIVPQEIMTGGMVCQK